MIEVEHLSKWYGTTRAVSDLSFRVDPGEVVGFLGPNGAGKSTTLRILAGFLGASSGRARIAGHDITEDPIRAREKLGYMPEMSPLYPEMRVAEYLAFRAALKHLPRRNRRDAVTHALTQARVLDMADVRIGHLSKGYRQRVGLADALVGSPPLLILDEPTAGLDPNQIREVRALIRKLGHDHTVLLSTHILSEVEATCSRALVIAKGRLVAEGSIDEIRAQHRSAGVEISVRGEHQHALAALERLPVVRRTKLEEAKENGASRFSIEFLEGQDPGAVIEQVVRALVEAKLGVREVIPKKASLEQAFVDLTESDRHAAAPDDREQTPSHHADAKASEARADST